MDGEMNVYVLTTGGGVISTISGDSGDSGAGVSTFLRWRNDVRVMRGGAAGVARSSSVDSYSTR